MVKMLKVPIFACFQYKNITSFPSNDSQNHINEEHSHMRFGMISLSKVANMEVKLSKKWRSIREERIKHT